MKIAVSILGEKKTIDSGRFTFNYIPRQKFENKTHI